MSQNRPRGFCTRRLEGLLDNYLFAWISVGIPLSAIGVWLRTAWGWIKTELSLPEFGLMLLLISLVLAFVGRRLLHFVIYSVKCERNPFEIASKIDCWFSTDIDRQLLNVAHEPERYSDLEKRLALKRGSSKKFLPMVGLKHTHYVEMRPKRFAVVELTKGNDPRPHLTRWLEQSAKGLPQDQREMRVFCGGITTDLGWPKGAVKTGLLYCTPLWDRYTAFKDGGGDWVRIILKQA